MKNIVLTLVVFLGMFGVSSGVQYEIIDLGRGEAYGINDEGQVIGTFGFWDKGAFTEIRAGNEQCIPSAINNSGQVTGFYNGGYGTNAFLWEKNREIVSIPRLPSHSVPSAEGYGINDAGVIVGGSINNSGYFGPFIWDEFNGTRSLVDDPYGYSRAIPNAINNMGQVVGSDNSGIEYAFIWNGAQGLKQISFDSLPYMNMCAYGINDLGQVVGKTMSPLDCAFLWDEINGARDLGKFVTNDRYAEAYDINNQGQIVGFVNNYLNIRHAALFDSTCNGNNIDLNTLIDPSLGWTLKIANDINNNGQIVGVGDINGFEHAFILNPIPEPCAFALLALGVFIWKRRVGR